MEEAAMSQGRHGNRFSSRAPEGTPTPASTLFSACWDLHQIAKIINLWSLIHSWWWFPTAADNFHGCWYRLWALSLQQTPLVRTSNTCAIAFLFLEKGACSVASPHRNERAQEACTWIPSSPACNSPNKLAERPSYGCWHVLTMRTTVSLVPQAFWWISKYTSSLGCLSIAAQLLVLLLPLFVSKRLPC